MPKDGRICLLIGRRGSGKSVLMEDLMYNLRSRFDFGIGMATTKTSIDMMESHLPKTLVYKGFSTEQFEKMVLLFKTISNHNKQRNGVILLDDCNADKSVFKSNSMRDAFMNGRHFRINIIWAMQYCMDIGPDLRTQVDYVFVLKENFKKNKEKLYNNFFGMFDKFDDFSKVLDKCTENHECLVLDNTVPDPNPQKCLFYYKAQKDPPPFKIGKEVFYKLSDMYERADREDEAEIEEMLKVRIGKDTNKLPPSEDVETFMYKNEKKLNPRVERVDKMLE
jgi:hypothetical protein